MATISELNVRLGLLYKDFDKSLSAVEKRLERSGRKFSQLGNDLTLAVTVPLAALGASAIQQAGEIEALKLAMTSTFEAAGRSAAEAATELEALREVAKAPGLDFEQAVKGSIRLQGVGLAAEDARHIIAQLANAIALTGGTADDLDGVTRQFSQMIAKGRVLQEDVSIIAERMPRISSLMQQAFGTASVEAIRASGVSAKEFVARITEAATVLPRVEGGIKNALVNAGAEARNSLAKLGEAISKAFDVPGLLQRFSTGLAGAVKWFDGLSDSAKRTIVQVGAFAIAVGPAVKVLGAMQGAAAQAISIFGSVAGGLKTVAGAMLSAASSATSMRVAFIAATGGIAAVVLGIAAAVTLLSDEFDTAAYATEQFEVAQKSVNEEASKEVGQLNKNINVLKDVRSSTEDRKKAADALLAAYPGYLKGVDLEKASLARLNEVQKELTANIIRGIAERKKADAINAIYEKQAAILLRIQEIQRSGKTTVSENTLIDTGDLIRNGSRAAAIIEKLQAQVGDLGKQANITAADFDRAFGLQTRAIDPLIEKEYRAREAADDSRDAFLGLNTAVKDSTDSASGASGAAADSAMRMAKAYRDAIKSIEAVGAKGEILDSEILGEKAKEVETQMERLIEMGFGPSSKPIQTLKKYLIDIRAQLASGFANANAAQAAVMEIERVSAALGTLKNAQASAGSRASAIEELTSAYPEYLRGIDLEKAGIEQLADLQNTLTAAIQKTATARKNSGAGAPAGTPVGAAPSIATLPTATSVQSIEVSGVDAAIGRMQEFANSLGLAQSAFVRLNETSKTTGEEIAATWGHLQAGVITFGDAVTQSANLFQERYGQIAQDMLGKIGEIAAGIVAIQANRAEQEKAILDEEYAAKLAAVQGNATATKKIQDELAARKKEIDKKVAKNQQTVAIVQAVINTALGITQALSSAPPPYNFILAALTAAAGAIQIATIKSQSFAEGGVVTRPTLGLVGEYVGASTNPEIITPERKMRQVFREESAYGMPMELYSVIRGEDLLLVTDKAARRRERTT